MSRSYKHNPITSWTCIGSKTRVQHKFKTKESRKRRKNTKQLLKINILNELVDLLLPSKYRYGNLWYSPSDGRQRIDNNWWKEQGLRWNKWLKK